MKGRSIKLAINNVANTDNLSIRPLNTHFKQIYFPIWLKFRMSVYISISSDSITVFDYWQMHHCISVSPSVAFTVFCAEYAHLADCADGPWRQSNVLQRLQSTITINNYHQQLPSWRISFVFISSILNRYRFEFIPVSCLISWPKTEIRRRFVFMQGAGRASRGECIK